jgi:L-ascorbate metabolism protein UlaG (beta-lactamase superfamily)
MAALEITWFGHSTFALTTPGGKRVVFDPWLEGNPKCPPNARIDKADVILVSHGHSDHTADVVSVARATGAAVVGIHELSVWLERKGLQNVTGMSIGGTITVAGLQVSMTPAVHSSSVVEGDTIVYLGEPAGFVVRLEDGRAIYFAGDTALFGDMRLIRELYAPEIAFLPIGDHYTMGPEAAAQACRLLGVRQVVPMHYGTFPILTGTPEKLKALVDIDVLVLKPGETAK